MAKNQKILLPTKNEPKKITSKTGSMISLENQFLIAMPSLADPYFNKSVTYICEHNEEGAMGLIINLPVNITLFDLLNQIKSDDKAPQKTPDKSAVAANSEETATDKTLADIADSNDVDFTDEDDIAEDPQPSDSNNIKANSLEQLVLSGGPIAQQRGFVLHTIQEGWDSSLALSDEVMITTSKDILMALGTDKAPDDFIVALGYAGWDAGQLEQELQDNSWLTIPADSELLFKTPIEQRWKKAAQSLGIDIAHLSSDVGHA